MSESIEKSISNKFLIYSLEIFEIRHLTDCIFGNVSRQTTSQPSKPDIFSIFSREEIMYRSGALARIYMLC